MMLVMALAAQAGQPGPGARAYAECVSTRINADPRMVEMPAEESARLAIHADAVKGCTSVRTAAPKAEAAMLDRIDASMRSVLANPQAAEIEDGDAHPVTTGPDA